MRTIEDNDARAGVMLHLMKVTLKRVLNGETVNWAFQGRCKVCWKKTTHACSECRNFYICYPNPHSPNDIDALEDDLICFKQHLLDYHVNQSNCSNIRSQNNRFHHYCNGIHSALVVTIFTNLVKMQ